MGKSCKSDKDKGKKKVFIVLCSLEVFIAGWDSTIQCCIDAEQMFHS